MRVLYLRAGALGDVLLLRSAIAGLHAAGHEVGLLAPAGPGSALRGPGPSEVRELLLWDAPEIARWLVDANDAPAILDSLRKFDAALAFTRAADVVDRLRSLVKRVIVLTPPPPLTGGNSATSSPSCSCSSGKAYSRFTETRAVGIEGAASGWREATISRKSATVDPAGRTRRATA